MDWREDWDAECCWRPWAVHPDPIGTVIRAPSTACLSRLCVFVMAMKHKKYIIAAAAGQLELDLVWENISAAAAVHGHPTKPASATHWRLHVLDPSRRPSYSHRIFSLQVQEHIS